MVAVIIGYPPPRYATQIITSWVVIWAGLIGWQLWYPELRPWPFRHVPQNGQAKPVHHNTASPASLPSGGSSA